MVGRTKLVQADREAPFYLPLRDLVVIVLGPAQVLGEELAGLDGVSAAAIFGSWAARALGEAGSSPVDIDLLVIGRPDRDDLHEHAAPALLGVCYRWLPNWLPEIYLAPLMFE